MKKETTASRLKSIMASQKLKQVDLLKKCSIICDKYNKKYNLSIQVTKSDLSQWLSGKYEPSQNKLSVLAEALNTCEAWLMGFDVNEVSQKKNELFNNEEQGIFQFKQLLKEKGFLNENEEISEDDFNRLIEFAKRNKEYIMKDDK